MRRGAPVVIGVGNGFRHDDGAGPAVVSALLAAREALPRGVRLAVCDGEPTRMIELWDHAGLAIVIDAAAPDPEAGRLPGDVVRWETPRTEPDAGRRPRDSESPPPDADGEPPAAEESAARVASPIRSDSAGTHALGPGTAVRLARVLDRLPERLLLLAIVGADFRPGPGLSEAVADAVANTARQVAAELRQGLSARSDGDLGPWPGPHRRSQAEVMTGDVDSARPRTVARRWEVHGTVQGVGFRPFTHRLATELGLSGSVRNIDGAVEIDAVGDPVDVDTFRTRLAAEAPPLASITDIIEREPTSPRPVADPSFVILSSADEHTGEVAEIPPDAAICDACVAELFDPADRRHRYPFINCTDCGPRATIIDDLPYDRSRTSMAGFPLCPECQAEYLDPSNRRFHAEPVACPACGPELTWWSSPSVPDQAEAAGDPALAFARQRLEAGGIIAVKGLGGYQLVCDATDQNAVARLRAGKHRPDKPFAVMARDMAAVRALACVTRAEEQLLTSAAHPIVLVRPWPEGIGHLASGIAPDAPRLGLLLPTTGLHHLLLRGVDRPLVVTSGNVADAPIVLDDAAAREVLGPVCDGILAHDRPILARYDDSVARVVAGRVQVVRRARGYAPAAIDLPIPASRPLLAVGAQLKHTFTLAVGGHALVGAHTGDLSDLETLEAFSQSAARMAYIHRVKPEVAVHDLHQGYLSTQSVSDWTPGKRMGVQHHHAHIASCAAEHGITAPVLGVAYDGLGMGDDGTLWGGEILLADLRSYQRLARFGSAPMPGGEAAVRHPLRMALGYLVSGEELGGTRPTPRQLDAFLAGLPDREPAVEIVLRLAGSGVRSPRISSAGRLFDAASAILGLCDHAGYEGHAAVMLEAVSEGALADPLPWRIARVGDLWVLDTVAMLTALLARVQDRVPVPELAAAFHQGLAMATVGLVRRCAADSGVRTVCLSGGVWQNQRLTEQVFTALSDDGFQVLINERVPANDGGISYGQAAIAAARTADP